ncbi:hypothetical protein Tco_1013227 [Tanacetum coccineum]
MLFYGRTYTLIVLSHVMSIATHIDPESISQTDRARSSRVPVPLPDNPYMVVRQVYLATITDSESEPFEDSRETEIPQSLPIAPSPVPPSDNPYLIVRHAHTHATINTKSEPEEAPSKTEEFQPLAARTTPPSLDHTPISFDSTPVSPLIDEEFKASEPSDTRITSSHSIAPSHHYPLDTHSLRQHPPLRFPDLCTIIGPHRYRSSYDTPSPSSSLTFPIRKRYQEDEGPGLEDVGPGSEEEEEAAPEGEGSVPSTFEIGQISRSVSKQQRVEETPAPRPPVRATWVDHIDGTVYTDILIYVPPVCVPVQTPPSPEWSFGSLPVSPSSLAVPTLVASPGTTLAAIIAVDEGEFLKGYDRDLRELYTRSRAVRDEIFSQCYRLRSLEQEQERATVTFDAIWRPVLALESWA